MLVLIALTMMALPMTPAPLAAPKADPPVRTTIYDTILSTQAPTAVRSDAPDAGFATYTDYQYPGGGDECVNGVLFSTGEPFIRLNRRQGFDNGLWCNHPENGGDDRSYTIVVSDAGVCAFAGLAPPCSIVPDNDPYVIGVQPRLRAATAFKNKAKATRVAFLFEKNGFNWVVETVTDAAVGALSAKERLVTHTGNGRVSTLETGAVGAPFPMPLQIRFQIP
jgi:hypothetical protein